MPIPRRKPRRKKIFELPKHLTRKDVEINWRLQCRRQKYHTRLSLNMPIEEIAPLKYIIVKTQADLWAHTMSMCLDMNLPSAYVEPLFTVGNAYLQKTGKLLAAHIFLIIKNQIETNADLLKVGTIHYEPKFDPPKLFQRLLRVRRFRVYEDERADS